MKYEIKPSRVTKIDKGCFLNGVCSGISEYFDINVNFLRFLWIMSVICYGVGLITYILLCIILPEDPNGKKYFR